MAMTAVHIAQSILVNIVLDQICYPPYGCFRREDPFKYVPLPQDPNVFKSEFILFTKNDTEPTLIDIQSDTLPRQLNASLPTIFIIHGYLENKDAFWIPPMVTALTDEVGANVIVLDWGRLSKFPYIQAVSNVRLVGAQLFYFLEKLFLQGKADPAKVHLIGFSLGAQLSAIVSDKLQKKGTLIGRITGLDPAGPYFENADKDIRLDPTDAEFVDVIHTDSKLIVYVGFGTTKAAGHVDFYPNKGYNQPGCRKLPENLFSKDKIFRGFSCSHYRAAQYFTESVSDKQKFLSYRCSDYKKFRDGGCHYNNCSGENCNNMGYYAQNIPGSYYLNTNEKEPFAAYHYIIEVTTGTGVYSDSLSKLHFELFSEKNKSDPINSISRYLEYGSEKKYLVHTKKPLSPLTRLKVRHEALMLADAWLLNKVVVYSLHRKERYIGCANEWLNGASVEIDLLGPTEETINCPQPPSKTRNLFSLWV